MNTGRMPLTSWTDRVILQACGLWLAVFLGLASAAYLWHGTDGLTACAIAAVTCVFAILAGRWASVLFSRPPDVAWRVLFGMLPRMGIPLAVCMVVGYQRGSLYSSGTVYYVLVLYAVTLALDTLLTLRRIPLSVGKTGAT